ncbi:hypothetical protein [Marinifilum sp.]|uniref:hypothetical protein n=1 Tax=Marinifilum sp. TaxID=2033137 RepID=UPI003BAA449C
MKKTVLNFGIVLALLVVSFAAVAQKSVNKSISYQFIQLPSHPLNTNKFDYVVYQNDENEKSDVNSGEEIESLIKGYQTEINFYYEQMSELDQEVIKIGESKDLSLIKKQVQMGKVYQTKPAKPQRPKVSYDQEMELYVKEMKMHTARLDSVNKSELKMIFKAQLKTLMAETRPRKPFFHPKTKSAGPYRLSESLIAERMKIRGLEREYNEAEKVFFEISLSNFETKEEEKKSREKTYKMVKYRRVTGYKAIDENNQIIAEGLVPGTDDWKLEKFDLDKTESREIKKKISELEKETAINRLYDARDFLAERYAYPIKKRWFELSYAKGKDNNYDDISKAYDIAKNTLEKALTKETPNLEDLKKAIEIWERELKEANYDNKKARISAQVAKGLYFNIIECSIWLNDFNKAQKLTAELEKLDLKSKEERKLKNCREFMLDRKQRCEANNKLIAEI